MIKTPIYISPGPEGLEVTQVVLQLSDTNDFTTPLAEYTEQGETTVFYIDESIMSANGTLYARYIRSFTDAADEVYAPDGPIDISNTVMLNRIEERPTINIKPIFRDTETKIVCTNTQDIYGIQPLIRVYVDYYDKEGTIIATDYNNTLHMPIADGTSSMNINVPGIVSGYRVVTMRGNSIVDITTRDFTVFQYEET
jgi:hypothetical protein